MQLLPRLIKADPFLAELEDLWMRKNVAVVSQQSSCEYAKRDDIVLFSRWEDAAIEPGLLTKLTG